MRKNWKYIIILSFILIVFSLINDLSLRKNYEFDKTYEYIFEGKRSMDVLNDCRETYDNHEKATTDSQQILSMTKIIELNEYLLYKDNISSKVYYDLLKTILVSTEIENLKDKVRYSTELDTYLTRKRKTGIEYIKYEVSTPVFYSEGNKKYGYSIVIRSLKSNIQYLKYNFVYENNRWYYKDFNTINSVRNIS